jgi:hypothetical protein
MNFNIVVALQCFDAIQATTFLDVKGNFLQIAHFFGCLQNESQAIQHDHDSLGFRGLQQSAQQSAHQNAHQSAQRSKIKLKQHSGLNDIAT